MSPSRFRVGPLLGDIRVAIASCVRRSTLPSLILAGVEGDLSVGPNGCILAVGTTVPVFVWNFFVFELAVCKLGPGATNFLVRLAALIDALKWLWLRFPPIQVSDLMG